MRKTFTPTQKATIALEAIKGEKTIPQISSIHGVHPTQVSAWKKHLLDSLVDIFSDKRKREHQTTDRTVSSLYQLIGKRETELEWLKKKMQPFTAIDSP
jgi:putative transposase